MKPLKINSSLFSALGVVATLSIGAQAEELESMDESLEPCINGGVSASGLYVSQREEDAANQLAAERSLIGSGAEDVISAFGGNRDDFQR